MHAGLGLLRLEASAFWRLTPIELAAALGGMRPRIRTPGRAGLETLMRLYPDETRQEAERSGHGPG